MDTADPDLTRIVEVGFSDIMAGASSPQSSRVDWLSVSGTERQTCEITALTTNSLLYRSSAALANDGNLGTHWMSEGDNYSLTAELVEPSRINGLEIAWWKNLERTAFFGVDVSTDGSTWTTVLPAQEAVGVERDFEYYSFPEVVQASFLRIVGHENSVNGWNSIAELRILGTAAASDWFSTYPDVSGWYHVDWLGYIYADASPWILHTGLGWIYVMPPQAGSFLIWDKALGWLFTSEAYFPTLYAYGSGKWYLFSSGPNPRWFYNLSDGGWESH